LHKWSKKFHKIEKKEKIPQKFKKKKRSKNFEKSGNSTKSKRSEKVPIKPKNPKISTKFGGANISQVSHKKAQSKDRKIIAFRFSSFIQISQKWTLKEGRKGGMKATDKND
jgi:hypothetical protein